MKIMKKSINLLSLILGSVLIVHGSFTALTFEKKKDLHHAVKIVPIQIVHDTLRPQLQHDTVFSITKVIKKITVITEKPIDSELVYNAYLRSFMIRQKIKIQVKKYVPTDSIN